MEWWLWVVVGVLALGGEAFSMALFLLNVAIAAFVVSALVLLGALSAPAQVVLFIVLALLLIGLMRPRLLKLLTRHAPPMPLAGQGSELVNRLATVTDAVTCDSGMIQVGKSDFWTARLSSPDEPIEVGRRVRIASVRGLTAYVEPLRLPVAKPEPTPAVTAGAASRADSQTAPLHGAFDDEGDAGGALDGVEAPSFGTLLKRYRLDAKLTQEELAERAKLSVRAISDLERGLHRAPQRDTVNLLADALALSPGDRAALAAARHAGPRRGTAAGAGS